MIGRLREDIAAMSERDPAAKGRLEDLLTYPGRHAVWSAASHTGSGTTTFGSPHDCSRTSSAG